MFMLCKYSPELEKNGFMESAADYFYCLLCGMCFLLGVDYFYLRAALLSHGLLMMIVYLWARKHPHVNMSFWGLFTFKAAYLPWVMLLFTGNIRLDLAGIVAGHLYWFLTDVLPRQPPHRRLLETPIFIKRWLGTGPNLRGAGAVGGGVYRAGAGALNPEAIQAGGHNWGHEGRRLGRD
eukprot:CAMPEP_0184645658 /NCGR_PEP_ID=MMETSP0308-20130426/2170_1 /TAXON_ID=38269 /ORGANISM="Gloeochaete witrockiana, Strain SAG 46.84" /LENGTH=178 /DNA_ID=CAMNT_0027074875 /DNA_START=386 /DNA_END=922 /DNA_ORIENTATION=+